MNEKLGLDLINEPEIVNRLNRKGEAKSTWRDKRYEKVYRLLKYFNGNLGMWIQFKPGHNPLCAQKTLIKHFKVFLRAYLNALGNRNINNDIDYDDVNKVLKEKDWDAFVDRRDRFFVNELADTATSSGSFQPFSLGS